MANPFLIFPWQRPFLPDLKDFIEQRTNGHPGSAVIIAPHKRPWRYMSDLYANDGKAAVLPRMLSISDVIDLWNRNQGLGSLLPANQLDQVALLKKCVNDLATGDENLERIFADMEMAAFFPWGTRLAALLEELFTQGISPVDMNFMEDEVAPAAAALLGAIGRIKAAWQDILGKRGLATPGLACFHAASHADAIPESLCPTPQRPVFIAGFHALNGTEAKLFRSLWKEGAQICLHTDPAIAADEKPHWTCAEHADWVRRWHASTELTHASPHLRKKPNIYYFAGYDCHSQLEKLTDRLEKETQSASTAIVLAQPDLLLPALHHLPRKDVNISMGYPLSRSMFANLLEGLFELQTGKVGNRFYLRTLLKTLRHPYLRMLEIGEGNSATRLSSLFNILEKNIPEGQKYISFEEILNSCPREASLDARSLEILAAFVEVFFTNIETAASLGDMAQALGKICEYLILHGGKVWKHFPLDAEAIWRIQTKILPVLANSAMSGYTLALPALRGILKQFIEKERVPFEADPLVGIQLLGMLETRLLHFDKVIFLDASDDVLPGAPAIEPLLPDSLRPLLGLWDSRSREKLMAHNLFRLCAGCDNVEFYWQEGINRSSVFDGKKSRSRFVEQLIWSNELENKKLMQPGSPNFETARVSVHLIRSEDKILHVSPKIREILEKRLFEGVISPSLLDTYIRCPLQFAFRYLLRLSCAGEIVEQDDRSVAGTFAHKAMELLYSPFWGRICEKSLITAKDIEKCVSEALEFPEIKENLTASAYLSLQISAPPVIKNYLEKQPDKTCIEALEENLEATIVLLDAPFSFSGRIDRLDRRDGKYYLLDYKTGSTQKFEKYDHSLWRDQSFFAKLRAACEDDSIFGSTAGLLLENLKERIPSIQLPCYILMLHASGKGEVANAALVDLAESGEEKNLFPELAPEDYTLAPQNCGIMTAFVLKHILRAKSFVPNADSHCSFCDYASICGA